MKLRNSFISIGLASLLAGCGSSSNNSGGGSSSTSGGSGGTSSVVCVDKNRNAVCDVGEVSENVDTWDRESAIETNLTGGPLAYNGKNGYIFTAPPGSPIIYPATTVFNNELIYNQIVPIKDKMTLRQYVMPKFGGQEPSTQQKQDMADAFKTNINAHPDKKRYAVIAAVVNKIFADNSDIKNITVTADEIIAADIPSLADLNITKDFDTKLDDAIDAMETAGWADSGDTEFRYLSSKNGKLIGGTKEHNGLAVIDLANKTLKFTGLSVITDCGHRFMSSSVDATSGPSEPSMKGATLSSDGSSVYFNVPRKSDKSNANILGLFKTNITADGSIAVDETSLPEGDGKLVIAQGSRLELDIKSFAVAPDDSQVVVYDDQKNLRVYDGDLSATALGETDDTSVDALTGIGITTTNVYTAAEGSTKITKRSPTGDLAPEATIEVGFTANKMLVSTDGSKMLAIAKGKVTHIALINLSKDTVINKGSFKFESDVVAISPNFMTAALIGHEEDETKVINLGVKGFSTQGIFGKARGGAFISNGKLATTDGKHTISVHNITMTKNNNTLEKKMATAMTTLTSESLQIGPLNVVTSDLYLAPNYENIGMTWSSDIPSSNLNATTGKVTRPAIGAQNQSGKVSVALSGQFRDKVVSNSKEFNLTIRKKVPLTQVTTSINVGDHRGGHVSTNSNGKAVSINKDGTKAGIFILESQTDGSYNFVVGDLNTSDGATYHEFGEEEDGMAVAYTKDDQVVAVTDANNIYRYTVGADSVVQAQKISLAPDKIKGAVFNTANDKLAVLVSKPDGNYTTKVYDIIEDGAVTYTNDIAMDLQSYRGEMAINEDASVIYVNDKSYTIHAQTDTTHTSHAIDQRVRGVFYANGNLYVSNSNGLIFSFANGDLANKEIHYTGHNGRAYAIRGADNKLFVFLYAKNTTDGGISILNGTTMEEEQFIPSYAAYRGSVSNDGKELYFFNYSSPRQLSYTKLQ